MKFIYYPLVLLWLSIFGQVVLWFGQAKDTLYLSEGTSELKRPFFALQPVPMRGACNRATPKQLYLNT